MSGGLGIEQRQRALAERVRAYLDGPLRDLPTGVRLGPRLGGAAVLAVGAHPLGVAGERSPLQVEVVLAADEWARLCAQARPSDLLLSDPSLPGVVRVRGVDWLRERLEDPAGLWLRQRGMIVHDPAGRVGDLVRQALADFRGRVDGLVAAAYRHFREGFETADATLDGLGRRLLLARGVEAALVLPLLCRCEPYPPPEWLSWHLSRVCDEGERIAGLCGRAAAGTAVDLQAYAALRRLIDDTLDAAGHGEATVRAYRQWA